ncbi:hypothetical protein ACH5RR_029003 [Cinchona calisaya]|uniref:FBD domain-containing protein n=1 Tax=Cinchona calisaya TaxID=153742 RepID=A0ABD2YTP3_9GENT
MQLESEIDEELVPDGENCEKADFYFLEEDIEAILVVGTVLVVVDVGNCDYCLIEENRPFNFGEDFGVPIASVLLPAEDVFSRSFSFNNLKQLELLTGYTKYDLFGLEAVLEICPILETMVLKYSFQTDDDENLAEEVTGKIILRMKNLTVVKMKNYRGTRNELCVKDLLIRHKVALERIVAFPAEIAARLGVSPHSNLCGSGRRTDIVSVYIDPSWKIKLLHRRIFWQTNQWRLPAKEEGIAKCLCYKAFLLDGFS